MEKIRKKITNINAKKKIFLRSKRINNDLELGYNKIIIKISFSKKFFENRLA